MKNVLITGGTGLVGSVLSALLLEKGYSVSHLSRTENLKAAIPKYKWDYKKQYVDTKALIWADVIINLAGKSVADGRWTKQTREEIYNSRILSTRLLHDKIVDGGFNLEQFISGSATGIYENGEELQEETSVPASNFLADVVKDWEKEAFKFSTFNITTSAVRIGVVLSRDGGALPKLLQPIKWGVGADLGSGKQLMPWIHIEDLARLFIYLMENNLSGVYNGVASVNSNSEVNSALAQQLGKKIRLPNVPGFLLKLVLGEMSSVVLEGSNVSNTKTKNSGFSFNYENLSDATKELISS